MTEEEIYSKNSEFIRNLAQQFPSITKLIKLNKEGETADEKFYNSPYNI